MPSLFLSNYLRGYSPGLLLTRSLASFASDPARSRLRAVSHATSHPHGAARALKRQTAPARDARSVPREAGDAQADRARS